MLESFFRNGGKYVCGISLQKMKKPPRKRESSHTRISVDCMRRRSRNAEERLRSISASGKQQSFAFR